MRLLHTTAFTFQEFFDSEVPKYAILSHRWGRDEVSFRQFQAKEKTSGEGYEKIIRCCGLAAERDCDWVWIDTCCIDKTSSAELTEAINSMFRWYHDAEECYAYLTDVTWSESPDAEDQTVCHANFRQSLWFTRAWTLQELLSSSRLLFYDRFWRVIGCKGGSRQFGDIKTHLALNLNADISQATDIECKYLEEPILSHWPCVAKKMSWISKRQSTRIEDMAYWLLGLFGVNMPLLYGEGGRAFLRLQLEIIKKTDDESIFAWVSPRVGYMKSDGLLAGSPAAFAESGNVDIPPIRHPVYGRGDSIFDPKCPYTMTNRGLEFRLHGRNVIWASSDADEIRIILQLKCWKNREFVKIVLCKTFYGWRRIKFDVWKPSFGLQNMLIVERVWDSQPEIGPEDVIYIPQPDP